MAIVRDRDSTQPRRGRPRVKEQHGRLVRKNLPVDQESMEELRGHYGAGSDSETVRQAVESALLALEAQRLRAVSSAAGGPDDVYARTAGRSRLPVHLEPTDVPDDEKFDYPPR